jgi:hypothetical protein
MRRSYDLDANAWVRRAADTLSADVEPGALAPAKGIWSSYEPANSDRRFLYLNIGATVISLCCLVVSVYIHSGFFTFMAGLILTQTFTTTLAGKHLSPTKRDLRLLEDENDADVCLVSLSIRSGGKGIGEDRGVVWFSEGRLFYSGHRTSFVLGGQDVVPRSEMSLTSLAQREAKLSEMSIALRHPDGNGEIRVVPLKVSNSGPWASAEMRFRKRFYEFQRQPTYVNAPRQWPPLEP